MANMSYCRFENTLSDLADCVNALERVVIDGDYIKVSKAELEQLRDHYGGLAQHHTKNRDLFRQALYLGKRDVCIDMLKVFEPLEG